MAKWILIFTPDEKPWALSRLDKNGISSAEPSSALKDHVERLYGTFDQSAMFPFRGVHGVWIEWPD